MRRFARPLALLVGVCLFNSASGCYSGRDYAMESGARILPGMTMQEVSDELGNPDVIIRGDPGSPTSWVYRYEGGAHPMVYVLCFIFLVLLIVLLVASKGGGGGGVGGGGGSDGPPYQIRIVFNTEGQVVSVSPPHPVPGY